MMKIHLKELETTQGRVVQMPLEEWTAYSHQFIIKEIEEANEF